MKNPITKPKKKKKGKVVVLISDKVNFRTRNIIKAKEGYLIMTKELFHQNRHTS